MIGSLWNRKVEVVVLIASLAFNAGVGVTAGVRSYQERCEREDRPRHGRGFNLLEGLDLRPEQVERFQGPQDALSAELRDLHRTLRDEQAALTELLLAAEPDRQAVADQITAISALKESVQRRMTDHLLDIKAQLDPEQVESFNEILARRMARWQGPREGRGGSRGGHRFGPGGDHGQGPPRPPDADREWDGR
jgi:Spy/CpxP family protein refolding chaperone